MLMTINTKVLRITGLIHTKTISTSNEYLPSFSNLQITLSSWTKSRRGVCRNFKASAFPTEVALNQHFIPFYHSLNRLATLKSSTIGFKCHGIAKAVPPCNQFWFQTEMFSLEPMFHFYPPLTNLTLQMLRHTDSSDCDQLLTQANHT